VPVHNDALIDRDCTEERQQVKRSPVRGRAASLEKASCAEEQRACTARENTARTLGLPPDPVENFNIVHQGFLPVAAWHLQDVKWRGIGQASIGCQPQSPEIAYRFACSAIDAIGRVWDARQNLEGSCQVDLIQALKQKQADL